MATARAIREADGSLVLLIPTEFELKAEHVEFVREGDCVILRPAASPPELSEAEPAE